MLSYFRRMRFMDYWARFKRIIAYIPGTIILYEFILGLRKKNEDRRCFGPAPIPDFFELEKKYRQSPLSQEPDTFILYRIIGNDLVPRHCKGQSRNNLRFILENEPDFPECKKRFVVNRIVDPKEEQAIIRLIEEAGFAYLHIPFRIEEYQSFFCDSQDVPFKYAPFTRLFSALSPEEQGRVLMRIYRHKNNYVMHNNGARNAALANGRHLAKWILPWDGNCFITENAWHEIAESIRTQPHIPYFVVPMARITENSLLLDPGFHPIPVEEPQILFRRDSALCFNENFFYGRRPKVELFWRLGVPGDWDYWRFEPWDLQRPEYDVEAGCFAHAGWVARLNSGMADLEVNSKGSKTDRGVARNEAISALLDQLDHQALSAVNLTRPLIMQAPLIPDEFVQNAQDNLSPSLFTVAEQALGRGPYSVMDKTTTSPSGDPHDYWHPAPYYWPNPLTPSGRPYIKKDGRRVPGTRLYEPESAKYDRTRLQRLFDDTTILALAWYFHRDQRFSDHGARLVRTWFLDPATAMNPSLEYAQVRLGHNDDQGSSYGIIEMKDLYFFLDAVRILQAAGALSPTEQDRLKNWLQQYLQWLKTSPQGQQERAAKNNHGLYYDLQVAAIAAFLDEKILLRDTLRDSRFRILAHFDAQGHQPEEMRRTTTAHYCLFNLQGWIHMAQLAESCGEDFWHFEGTDGRGLKAGMRWLLSYLGKKWPYEQIDVFDHERFYPLYYTCKAIYGLPSELEYQSLVEPDVVKPIFFPHDGIRPFWQLHVTSMNEE